MEKLKSSLLLSAILTTAPNIAEAAEKSRDSIVETLDQTNETESLIHTSGPSEIFSMGSAIKATRPQLWALMPLSVIASHEDTNERMEAKEGPAPLIRQSRVNTIYALSYPSASTVASGEPEVISDSTPWYITAAIDLNTSSKNANLPANFKGVNLIPTINQAYAEIGKAAIDGQWSTFGALGVQAGAILNTQYPALTQGSETLKFADAIIGHLPQAYVGVSTPKNRELIVGVQTFPLGLKGSSPLTWNNYLNTPTLQGSTLPYFALGGKAFIPLNQNHGLEFAVMNGGENIIDGKKELPNMIAGYHLASNGWEMSTYGLVGSKLNSIYGVAEANVKYENKVTSLAALIDLGFMESAKGEQLRKWLTAGIQGRFQLPSHFSTAVRGEILFDKDGIFTGSPNNVVSQLGGAISYSLHPNLRFNVDYVLKEGRGVNNIVTSPILAQNDAMMNSGLNQAVIFSVLGHFDDFLNKFR